MKDKTVLIVDFDERSIEPLSKFLEEEGFGVLVARDGEEGLEMAKKERPQLVILEPMLPKLHGFELCGIISHDLEPKIPVIILTKFYREEQFKIESVRSFGASAFVSKPFKHPEMRELIGKLLAETTEEKPKPELGQDQDKEEINGSTIPDAIPAETMKELQKEKLLPISGKKEEVEVIEQDNLAKDLKDAISEEKPAESEVKKERDFGQELDAMLEDAFSDLSLVEPEKEAASVDGPSFLENSPPSASDVVAFKSETPAEKKEPALPELSVEELLAPEPKREMPPQDDVLSKIDELAQNTIDKPKADTASVPVEDPKNSPEKIMQKAEAVTEILEKELESKVKEMTAREETKKSARKQKKEAAAQASPTFAREIMPEPEAKKTIEEKTAVQKAVEEIVTKEKPVEEKVAEEKIEPAAVEEARPAAAASIEEEPAKAAETAAKPDLKDVVEKEGIFSGFNPYEEPEESSPSLVQNILAKFKKSPKKFIIPMAAVFLIIAVSGVIMIPSMSNNTPSEQASLGSPTVEQPSTAPVDKQDPANAAAVPTEDLNGADSQIGEGTTEEQEPAASQPAPPPEDKPEPKPEQKPVAKSTPPPPAPAVDDIAETQVGNQLAGEMVPTKSSLESEAAARKSAPKNEAETGAAGNETESGIAAANPPAAKPENEPAPVISNVPAKAGVGDIVSIKQVDTAPELIQQELPRYPGAARGRGITGTVLLNALISENGDVLQTVVIRKLNSPYGFNEAAERAVKQWKFRPAWKDGVRVKVWKVIPIKFKENMDY